MNKNRGSLFYVVVLILSILAGIAGILIDIAISDNQSTQLAYRSEIALNLSEAISEEFFRNMEAMMNTGEKGPIGGVYDKLREEVSEGEVIPISNPDHITKYLAPHSLQLCKELGQCQAFVEAQIKEKLQSDMDNEIDEAFAASSRSTPLISAKEILSDIEAKEKIAEVKEISSAEVTEESGTGVKEASSAEVTEDAQKASDVIN